MTRHIWREVILTPLLVTGAFSQTFEVASVKQNRLDDRIVGIHVGPGNRFSARGYTLGLLIQRAYGVMGWNISGGPAWIHEDRFDVIAKANISGNLTDRQLQPMLVSLLAERFKLKLHNSTKEISGYALGVAKGGPKLTPSAETEEQADTFRLDHKGIRGQGISMPMFARFVAGKLYEVGVDQTGITGLYDFDVKWTLERDPDTDPRDALRRTVIEGLQKLGLTFTPKKVTVPVLVIDNAEKPSEN